MSRNRTIRSVNHTPIMKRIPLSRRRFLGTGAALAGLQIVPGHVLGLRGQTPPSEKLNIGFVGAGGRAGANLGGCASQNIYALCDVDEKRCAGSVKKFEGAKFFKDWRRMLDEAGKNLDAVVVSTPDHTHAVAAMAAIQRGKAVYCEKPLTRTVSEARAIKAAARKHKVATQMGNQGHATDGARQTNEWIQSGAIGAVREVHCRSDRPIWPQDLVRPPAEPVPAWLDWDLWLGPSPAAPYSGKIAPFAWRGYWEYGAGALGDMGAHIIDHPVWALGLDAPTSVVAEFTRKTPGSEKDTFPQSSIVTYQFPAKADRPAVTLKWFDGKNQLPRPEGMDADDKPPGNGVIYYGSKFVMTHGSHGGAPKIVGKAKAKEFTAPPKTLARSPGHYQEWFDAIKKGDPTLAKSNFDHAAELTELMLLGCVATRVGSGVELKWDAAKGAFDNDVANRHLQHEYRKGWVL